MSKKRNGPGVPIERIRLWQFQAVRDLLFVAALGGIIWMGHALRAVTVPLLFALLLAYLFEPIVSRLSRHPKASRPVIVGGLLATVGLGVVAALAVLIPVIVTQTAGLVTDYQQGRFRETAVTLSSHLPETWRERTESLIKYLPAGDVPPVDASTSDAPRQPRGGFVSPGTPATQEERIRAIVREEIKDAGAFDKSGSERWIDVARGGAKAAGSVIGGIVQLGFLVFLIPFYFFFFSVWYPEVKRFGRSLIPETNRPRALELLGKMDQAVAGFVRGRIVISVIMGVMLAVGWHFCRVPYSGVLGLIVGFFCAVPYLGGVGIPFAVGLLAFRELGGPPDEQMAWWLIVLLPTAWFGIVQVIEGYILVPLIAGRATNLDPVTILVAVLAGGSIMGIYGMLLAIPVAACIKILCTDVLLPKVRAWTRGEAADPLPLDR